MLRRNSGFTLTEVMVSLLILTVGMVGLLQAISLVIEVNLKNQLRDEAISLGEQSINTLRQKGFDNISTSGTSKTVYKTYSAKSRIRGGGRSFGITGSAQTMATQNLLPVTKQLEVVVSWTYKGVPYENRVVTPISILR